MKSEPFFYSKSSIGLLFAVHITVSGSMRTNDSDGIAIEMIKALIEIVRMGEVRVGIIGLSFSWFSHMDADGIEQMRNKIEWKVLYEATN